MQLLASWAIESYPIRPRGLIVKYPLSHPLSVSVGSSSQYMNGAWNPGENQRTKATFLSSKALDCIVPSLSRAAVHSEDFMMEDKPYARWEMRVTHQPLIPNLSGNVVSDPSWQCVT